MRGGRGLHPDPASSFDPLYVVVPLGFTPPKNTLQCPVAGHCIDHPGTIDLSAVLGKGTSNLALPAHSHIVATANGGQSEWWNVDVVGVTSLKAWDKIVWAKSDAELQFLQRHDSKRGDREHHHQPVPVLLGPPVVHPAGRALRRAAGNLASEGSPP